MKCEHAIETTPHGARCDLNGKIYSPGSCKNCKSNTAAGEWPIVLLTINAAPLPSPAPVQPIPRNQWPFAAKVAYMARSYTDKGVGDTIARLAEKMGAAWLAKEYEALTGKVCGCGSRQIFLNQKYPYQQE